MRPKERRESYISGQKRRLTGRIKQELKRRSAVESFIGGLEADHRTAKTISPMRQAARSTPCLPPPATTSTASKRGSGFCGPASWTRF